MAVEAAGEINGEVELAVPLNSIMAAIQGVLDDLRVIDIDELMILINPINPIEPQRQVLSLACLVQKLGMPSDQEDLEVGIIIGLVEQCFSG